MLAGKSRAGVRGLNERVVVLMGMERLTDYIQQQGK